MMDLNDHEASAHGEMLFASEHGSAVSITPNFAAPATNNNPESFPSTNNQIVQTVFNTAMIENYAQMNSEYLRRRYKRKHENPEKIKELMADATSTVDNLRTAAEGKMDAAAIGIMHTIILAIEAGAGAAAEDNGPSYLQIQGKEKEYVEDAGDRQRALNKANICPIIVTIMRQLGPNPLVCEKALQCVAYLCRYSEEYKSSVCLENAKGFGVCGISDAILYAIKVHNSNKNVMSAACDAVRGICALASNRDRLGVAGVPDALARALIKYMNNPELTCWLCRAIGHVCNGHVNNLEALGANGACENIILALQKYPNSLRVCIECCYAIRNLALSAGNRGRLVRDFAPESILAVFKHHFAEEIFASEACHAIVNMISSETDEMIFRVSSGGLISYSIRALKKNPDSENLARWVFQGLYYAACDERMYNKLVTSEILDTLSIALENHASEENMAEWGCRFIEKVLAQASPHTLEIIENPDSTDNKEKEGHGESKTSKDNVKVVNKGSQALYLATCAKMRTAGMCEMITSAVQRQAISAVVASIGALCIGQLARDSNNQSRLSSAGACEAVVTALKRHSSHADVCTNTCYAIYYLCKSVNNIAWMGAYGACEAVCNGLKVYASDANVVRYASLAVAALAYKDEGNLERLRACDINSILVTACSPHIDSNYFIAENMCHAISNLCLESSNVSDLGKCGACGLVVSILYTHANMHTVVTQALTAIAALAVKQKSDKVHKGNTRKLVEKGALEVTIAVMQRFLDHDDVQRSGGLAIAALARLEANKLKLSNNNACEVITNSLQAHLSNPLVVVKLVYAIDALTYLCEPNISKFVALNVVNILHQVISKHESVFYVIESVFKALINICLFNKSTYQSVFTEAACKLYIKAMKLHEKHAKVARWGCHFIYVATSAPHMQVHPVVKPPEVHSPHSGDKDPHHKHKAAAPPKVERKNDVIPSAAISEVRKIFGLVTKAPEALVSIFNKYINSPEEKKERKEEKDSKDAHMNNMLNLHHFQAATHIEVLIYACMATYTLTLFEGNKKKFIDQDVSAALLKTLQQHYKEDVLCEWLLINVNNLLLTNYNEKVRLGQQNIMPCIFNVFNTYSHNTSESSISIIKLVCESTYELCLIYYNQQELVGLKEGNATIVDVMMGLIGLYKDNLDLITVIIKAISAICMNNSSSHKPKSNNSSMLFGISNPSANSTSSSENVAANLFVDNGLADSLVKLFDQHFENAPTVQWLCACVVSLCSKNTKVQVLFVSHFHLLNKLTPLLVQHKGVLPCVTQIARCFRSLVLNINDHMTQVASSPVVLPTMMELLQLHLSNDNLVEHASYLLGNIEYKPSRAMWSKLQQSVKKEKVKQAEELERATTPPRSYTTDLFNNQAAFQSPSNSAPKQLSLMSPTTPGAGASGVMSSKAFYTSVANYDLLFSLLQTHLNKNSQFNSNVMPSGPAPKGGNSNSSVIRSICMAITMFAEKGKLYHYNLCNTLYNLLSKETMLNNNDEQLIQKVLVCIGTLCKGNEQNNLLLTETNSLIDQVDIYINEYKESNAVLYGVFFVLIGICEYNLLMNQNKINGCANIIPNLVQILYNDLETEFVSQLGCTIIALLTKDHLKNRLKMHSVSNYIADVISTHRNNSAIVLDCLKAIVNLAHKSISNRNRLGTSDACQAVCSVFTPQVLEEELLNTAVFLRFPNTVYYYGVRCIGELAANHANNCTKLGAANACEILVKLLSRPSQSQAEYYVEMKMFSLLYWALANLLVPTRDTHPLPSSPAQPHSSPDSTPVPAHRPSSTSSLPLSLAAASSPRQVKNITRLLSLNVADVLVGTLERALSPPLSPPSSRSSAPATAPAPAPAPLPYHTLLWGARLLCSLSKSQKMRVQLQDRGAKELAQRMATTLQDSPAPAAGGKEWGEAKEWAQMALDALSNNDIPL